MPRSGRAGSTAVVSLALASCMRFGYEPLEDTGSGLDAGTGGLAGSGGGIGSFAGADGSGDTTADAATTDGSGSSTDGDASASGTDAGGASSEGSGGSSGAGGVTSTGTTSTATGGAAGTDAGGATSVGGATSTSTSAGGATSTSAGGATSTSAGGATSTTVTTTSSTTGGGGACAPTGTAGIYLASFAADLEGFTLTGAGGPTLTWNGSVGDPELGALELNASGGGAMQIKNLSPPADGSGRVMSVNVFVELGTSVDIVLYAQSGSPLKWAEGDSVVATAGQWYCLALDFDAPASTSASWDPTDLRTIGVDIQGSGAIRVYVDQFAY